MDNPNWATILETLHDAGVKRASKYDLKQFTNLSSTEIDEAIIYLQNARLVTEVSDGDELVLTPRGFDTAHERKINEQQETLARQRASQQHDVNVAIALLTLGLLAVGSWELIALIEVSVSNWNQLLTALAAVSLLTLVATAIAVMRAGLISMEYS